MVGHLRGEVAEVPLAHHPGRVTRLAQRLGQGHLGGRQPGHRGFAALDRVGRAEARDPGTDATRDLALQVVVAGLDRVGDAGAQGIATGEQTRARRGAARVARIDLGEARTLSGEFVETWRREESVPVGTEVAIAEVVGHDHDDVRRTCGRIRTARDHLRDRQRVVLGIRIDGSIEFDPSFPDPRSAPRQETPADCREESREEKPLHH